MWSRLNPMGIFHDILQRKKCKNFYNLQFYERKEKLLLKVINIEYKDFSREFENAELFCDFFVV